MCMRVCVHVCICVVCKMDVVFDVPGACDVCDVYDLRVCLCVGMNVYMCVCACVMCVWCARCV